MRFGRSGTVGLATTLVAVCLLMLSRSAMADFYDDALAAVDRKDYQHALRLLLPAARAGDARAEFALGVMDQDGQGMKKDSAASLVWLRKSAAQGYGPAEFNLGNAYKQGRGTKPDVAEAVRWWQRAARQGLVRAQYNLGVYWLLEQREERLQRLGMAWILQAADGGYEPSKELVGKLRKARPDGFADRGWLFEPEASEVRILASKPTDYVIQLVASSKLSSTRAFLDKEGLRGKALPFRFLKDGHIWYGIAYGSYADRAACVDAINRLPASLRSTAPWPRRFAVVQALIRSVQGVGD